MYRYFCKYKLGLESWKGYIKDDINDKVVKIKIEIKDQGTQGPEDLKRKLKLDK